MYKHQDLSDPMLSHHIRHGRIAWGGHRPSKIYGRLDCTVGKRMKRSNRVFFETENEALAAGYRPCASCLHAQYKIWKNGFIQSTA